VSAAGFRVQTRKRGPIVEPIDVSDFGTSDMPQEQTVEEEEEVALWVKVKEVFLESLIPPAPIRPKIPPVSSSYSGRPRGSSRMSCYGRRRREQKLWT
jgi:hypothetical protein